MSLRRKDIHLRQKAYFEQLLKDRVALLAGKGIEPKKVDKDAIVRKLRAEVKAMNRRLNAMAASEKIAADMAKIKADRAAAALKEKEGGKAEKPQKAEKPKKGGEAGKEKKAKPEKAAAPKPAEGI